MDWNGDLKGWLAALGIGLLIGVVRERHAAGDDGAPTRAGLRTHAILALVAAAAVQLGVAALAVVLVAVGPEKTALLRDELGADVEAVQFFDMRTLGRNPARLIPFWRQFIDAQGERPGRGVGEPVWPGRTPAEIDECERHEALLNLAFGGDREWSMRCPYDGAALKFYVSGAMVHSQAVTGLIRTSTGALRIGGNAVWGEWFRGLIDEVRVYNQALSQAEPPVAMS